jgi:hypothetical protein
MKKSIRAMLNDTEQALLRHTEGDSLAELDEDELLVLHAQVRRARNKYAKLYRRRASAQVGEDATRAGAHAKHARTAVKAEVFERALAKVSRRLARAARARADQLRAERLRAAGKAATRDAKGKSKKGRATSGGGGAAGPVAAKAKRRTPASERATASTRATTRRAQAKRDAR